MPYRPFTSGTNPIIPMDFPDPDILRVGDAYYMVSTTMYFMPGCVILRSHDLIHWGILHPCVRYAGEHACPAA